jgi:hypothetical protein
MRLQRSRWNVDDQPLRLTSPAGFELRGDEFDMPIVEELSVGIEFVKAPLDEPVEVVSEKCLVLIDFRSSRSDRSGRLPAADFAN